jgi:hypothetical protein
MSQQPMQGQEAGLRKLTMSETSKRMELLGVGGAGVWMCWNVCVY